MPDINTPYSIQPVNPMQSLASVLQTANGMQALKNSQQQFQIDQQTLRKSTAEADQAEQIQRERSAINAALQDPTSGVRNEDGTFNIQRAMQIFPKIAPQTFAQYGETAAHSLQSVNEYLTSQQKVGQDAAAAVGSVLRSAVGTNGKPKMSMMELNANLANLEDANPNNPAMTKYVSHVRKLLMNYADKPEDLNQVLGGLADSSVSNFQLRESQRGDTSMLNNGRATIPVNVQPGNGPVGQATGVSTANQLDPSKSVELVTGPDSNRYQVFRDPTTGVVTGSSAIGGQGGAPGAPGNGGQGGAPMPHYAPGQLADTQAAQQEVQQVRNAGSQVVTNRHITDTLLDLTSNAKDLGPNSDKWAHAFGTLGMAFDSKMPEVDKFQTVSAYLDRMALQSAQAMGLSTDAARSMAANSVGTTGMTRDALREKVRFADALNTGLEAYRIGLDRAVGTGGNQNFAAKRQFDSQWSQNADPMVFRLRNAQMRGDKEDYQATLARIKAMPTSQRNAILAHAQAINQLVGGQQ